MKSHFQFSILFPGIRLLHKNISAFAKEIKVTGDKSDCPTINGILAECHNAVLSGAWEGRRLRHLDQQRDASCRYRARRRDRNRADTPPAHVDGEW